MRIFNRIIVILLLAGLVVLGAFGIVYSLGLLGYTLSELPQALGLQQIYDGAVEVVDDTENGTLTDLTFFIMVGVALLGLILLILELKPRSPRRVKMQRGTYATRNSVKNQVLAAADQSSEMISSSAKVKARRSPGAKIKLKGKVRRGENVRNAGSSVRDQVGDHLGRVGIPVSRIKVKLSEADPRTGEKRVN
ncbi:MAG: alkaline shock response membrane anchor protein AmaP [Actinomycetota bacterium]|nr:alkaline shock response membrane anchor protein AmaP [Actinomycetota bacterium]HZY64655.1 hypothetical protein [Rubrobacteraceae bacterium]